MTIKNRIGPIIVIAGLLAIGILVMLFINPKPQPFKPAPVIQVPAPSPAQVFTTGPEIETRKQSAVAKTSKPAIQKTSRAAAAAAPLPRYAYEGDTILGFDIPPRLYVMVEANTHPMGAEVLPKPCEPFWFNSPCHVETTASDGTMVRLRVFRCVNVEPPPWSGRPAFDQGSCARQRAYDQWVESRRKERMPSTPED